MKDQAILDENVDNEPLAGGQEVDLSQLTQLVFSELETGEPFPLTPAIHAALERSYRTVREDDDRTLYAPRPSAAP